MVTGVEATGIVLAVIPITLQGYRAVCELASQYSGYNRTLYRILVDIETYEGLFKEALDQLLADIVEEDNRNIILENLCSGREFWNKDGLEEEFRSLLGSLFQPVINSIQGAQETLEEIKKILLKLSDKRIPTFKHLVMSMAGAISVVVKTRPPHQMKDIQIRSAREKVMGIIKDTQGKLRSLRDDLKRHNESVIHALQLRRSNTTRKLRHPTHVAGSIANGLPRQCLNARAMQLASRKLYGLTGKALLCDCHQFHLRLDYQGNESLPLKSKCRSKISSPTELETRFSFQMTAKSDTVSEQNQSRNSHQLIFTGCDPNSTYPVAGECTSALTICEGILGSSEGYERYFHDHGGPNGSFVLQRSSAAMIKHEDLKTTTSISLNHLVTSRTKELSPFDQLSIAANLASSIPVFYSTPWLQNWSLQRIHFFEKQEQSASTPGLWTPHLFLPFDNRDQSQFRRNGEIYSLGLVLLGLGRKRLLEYSEEGVDSVLNRALADVCWRMGSDYQRFVRKCLYEWGDQNWDFMEEKSLESFLFEITVLQTRSRDFNPED